MNFHLIFLISFFSTSFTSKSSRIFGGTPIDIEEVPFQIVIFQNSIFDCGGSLISEKFALSAAHCFGKKPNATDFSVKVGTNKLSDNSGMTINVKRIFIHRKFNSFTGDYDFALLKLFDVAELPKVVKFAKLPSIYDELFDGEEVFVSGWGRTETEFYSDVLLGGSTTSYNFGKCSKLYKNLTPRMICAGSEKDVTGPCFGDSGGPLVRISDGMLFGVTSFGKGCGIPNYPAVFAKVTSVLDWIYKTMNYGGEM